MASAIDSTATFGFVKATTVPPWSQEPHFSKSRRASDGTMVRWIEQRGQLVQPALIEDHLFSGVPASGGGWRNRSVRVRIRAEDHRPRARVGEQMGHQSDRGAEFTT
jgi:hypothetical protein